MRNNDATQMEGVHGQRMQNGVHSKSNSSANRFSNSISLGELNNELPNEAPNGIHNDTERDAPEPIAIIGFALKFP